MLIREGDSVTTLGITLGSAQQGKGAWRTEYIYAAQLDQSNQITEQTEQEKRSA